jgi:hypothetical protein
MECTISTIHPGLFHVKATSATLLTRNWVVVLIAVTLREFNEFKEPKEFREFSVISNLLTL